MEQKFALFSGSSLCLAAVQYLAQQNQLGCVVLVEAEPNPDLAQLSQILHQQNIPVLQFSTESDDNLLAGLDALGINSGLVYLFRNKLSARVINYFAQNLVNVHASALPAYRGPMPLFWQVIHGAETIPLSLHLVTEQLDAGPIATQIEIAVHPFDTGQCVHQKVAQMLPALLEQYFQQKALGTLNWQQQTPLAVVKSRPQEFYYARYVQLEDLIINWSHMTSTHIVDLARAANGDLGGARFHFRDGLIQLMQATRIDSKLIGIKPGTVIELDRSNGLLIKTLDGAIRLDAVLTEKGIFDGYRFANLFGLEPGLEIQAGPQNRY